MSNITGINVSIELNITRRLVPRAANPSEIKNTRFRLVHYKMTMVESFPPISATEEAYALMKMLPSRYLRM